MNSSYMIKILLGNINRNKWLAIGTMIVMTVVFSVVLIFGFLNYIINRASDYAESVPRIEVYFLTGTPESEITEFIKKYQDHPDVKSYEYISEEDALQKYIVSYGESSAERGFLPASVVFLSNNLDGLANLNTLLESEKESNTYIQKIDYRRVVVDRIRDISRTTAIGGITLTVFLSFIAVILLNITISFNIQAHKNELEIMSLVGTEKKFIRQPFVMEGTLYGTIGGIFASLLTVIPWITLNRVIINSEYTNLVSELPRIGLGFLAVIRPEHLLILIGSVTFLGAVIGYIISSITVNIYMKKLP